MFAFIDSPIQILVVIGVLLVIFGPQKLPEMLGQLGRAIREFKRTTSDLAGTFNSSINTEPTQYEASYNPPRYDSYGNRVEDSVAGATVPEEDLRVLTASERNGDRPAQPEPMRGDFAASALSDPGAPYGTGDPAVGGSSTGIYGVMPAHAPGETADPTTEVKAGSPAKEVQIRPAEGAVPRRP